MPEQGIKICEECKKDCVPLVSHSKPDSSEWYCKKCHLSYPMDKDVAIYLSKKSS